MVLVVALTTVMAGAAAALRPGAGVKPHIIMHLADDFGFVLPVISPSASKFLLFSRFWLGFD